MNSPAPHSPARPTAGRDAPSRRPRRWLPYAGALLLIGAIVAAMWPRRVPVEVAPCRMGPLRVTVNEEGKTRIKQRFAVSTPVTGQVRRIPLKPGAEVQAGYTVVAVIDPLTPTLLDARSRTQAEARRDSARANLEKATA